PLLSTAMDTWMNYKVKAIQASVDSLLVDIFPKGDDFSVRSDTPSYTNQRASDKGASTILMGQPCMNVSMTLQNVKITLLL
ncbi:unnamed protein product, partial [marine sediment metagenome]